MQSKFVGRTLDIAVIASRSAEANWTKRLFLISKNQTVTLSATVLPADATNKAVSWSSSNPAVATVDSAGKVTAVAAGSATISVQTLDGGYQAACNVTVVIPIDSIALNTTTAEVRVESAISLSATINPADTTEDKTVEWSSSAPSIASVDSSGNVTGVSPGNVVIIAQVGAHTATCSVTVKPKITATIVDPADLTMGTYGTYTRSNGVITMSMLPSGRINNYGSAYGYSEWVENEKSYDIVVRFSEAIPLNFQQSTMSFTATSSGGDVSMLYCRDSSGSVTEADAYGAEIDCEGWGYNPNGALHTYVLLQRGGDSNWGKTTQISYIYGQNGSITVSPNTSVTEIHFTVMNRDIYHPSTSASISISNLVINGIHVTI